MTYVIKDSVAYKDCPDCGSAYPLPLLRSHIKVGLLERNKLGYSMLISNAFIQCDPSGRRLHFVDLDLVVRISALFCLGTCKSGRIGMACRDLVELPNRWLERNKLGYSMLISSAFI